MLNLSDAKIVTEYSRTFKDIKVGEFIIFESFYEVYGLNFNKVYLYVKIDQKTVLSVGDDEKSVLATVHEDDRVIPVVLKVSEIYIKKGK